MKQTGYLIANSMRRDSYFTASSAYDKPTWVPLKEATKYITAELAESALKKLLKNGTYAVRLIAVQEAMSFEFPEEEPKDLPTDIEAPIDGEELPGEELPDEEGMEAGDHDDVCPECDHEPCTCELGDDGEIDSQDIPMDHEEELKRAVFGDVEEEENANVTKRFSRGQTVTYQGNEYVVQGAAGNGISVIAPTNDPTKVQRVSDHDLLPIHEAVKRQSAHQKEIAAAKKKYEAEQDAAREKAGETYHYGNTKVVKHPVKESETMPAKPQLDAAPTVTNEPAQKVEKIKYSNTAQTDAPYDQGGDADDVKVSVPADVKSALKSAIDEFAKTADEQNGRDDARASFCMTTADAMRDLEALLDQGTVAGMKQAQIKLSTMMNPITSNIPAVVLKFIHMGGRKATLKDLFDNKRQEKKEANQ